VKEKLGRLGQVAAWGAELLAGVGVARRKGEIKILKKLYELLSKLVNEEYTMHLHIHSHNMLHGEII
jgi:hypothetical protein